MHYTHINESFSHMFIMNDNINGETLYIFDELLRDEYLQGHTIHTVARIL
jgi:hypothetical protein